MKQLKQYFKEEKTGSQEAYEKEFNLIRNEENAN